MSFFEDSTSPPTSIENDLLQFGIRPEILAELSPQDARVVISGMTKALGTIIHPDTGRRLEVMGLEIGDLNHLHARLKATDDRTLLGGLEALAETSIVAQKNRAIDQLERRLDFILDVNHELAGQVLDGYERAAPNISAQALIHPPIRHQDNTEEDLYDLMEREGLALTIKDGIVTAAYTAPAQGILLSMLPPKAQEKLTTLRPSVDDPAEYIFEDGSTAGLEVGWYKLVSATSKKNPANKQLAVKYYGFAHDDAYEHTSLIGSTLIGYYQTPDTKATHAIETKVLPSDPQRSEATVRALGNSKDARLITYCSRQEAAYMIARSIISPPAEPVRSGISLVLSPARGSNYMITSLLDSATPVDGIHR